MAEHRFKSPLLTDPAFFRKFRIELAEQLLVLADNFSIEINFFGDNRKETILRAASKQLMLDENIFPLHSVLELIGTALINTQKGKWNLSSQKTRIVNLIYSVLDSADILQSNIEFNISAQGYNEFITLFNEHLPRPDRMGVYQFGRLLSIYAHNFMGTSPIKMLELKNALISEITMLTYSPEIKAIRPYSLDNFIRFFDAYETRRLGRPYFRGDKPDWIGINDPYNSISSFMKAIPASIRTLDISFQYGAAYLHNSVFRQAIETLPEHLNRLLLGTNIKIYNLIPKHIDTLEIDISDYEYLEHLFTSFKEIPLTVHTLNFSVFGIRVGSHNWKYKVSQKATKPWNILNSSTYNFPFGCNSRHSHDKQLNDLELILEMEQRRRTIRLDITDVDRGLRKDSPSQDYCQSLWEFYCVESFGISEAASSSGVTCGENTSLAFAGAGAGSQIQIFSNDQKKADKLIDLALMYALYSETEITDILKVVCKGATVTLSGDLICSHTKLRVSIDVTPFQKLKEIISYVYSILGNTTFASTTHISVCSADLATPTVEEVTDHLAAP